MAYTNDSKLAALLAWAANHPEWGTTVGDLEDHFYTLFNFTGAERSGSTRVARSTRFLLAGILLGLTLTYDATNPMELENDFWTEWAALPPTPAA